MTTIINTRLDTIDEYMNYIGIHVLQLPTISFGIYRILPKHQVITSLMGIIFAFSIVVGQVYAGAGHDHGGGAEAEALGSGTGDVLGEQFVKPKNVDTASIANQSYPGIVMSDEYGSIFSARQGIVTKLHVNLGDAVRKGQTVATVSTIGNSPEIIALLAGKKADIAVSEGQLAAARKVSEYLESQVGGPDNATQNVYAQKSAAITISITTQKQQLQAKINSLKTQIDAKIQVVGANKISSQSVLGLNAEKQQTIEKELQGSIQHAITKMGMVFAKGEIELQGFMREFQYQIYWGARSNTQRNVYTDLMYQVLNGFANRNALSTADKFALATLTEKTLKEGITMVGVSIIHSEYSAEQMSKDIDALVNAYADKDIGLTTILARYKELQQEQIGSNALASGGIIQANAELLGLEQEIILLTKQVDLLDAESKKLFAELNADQSLRVFDLQKMLIESQSNIITAQATVQAHQNALGAIQSTTKTTSVVAPFDGTISRKNIVIGQSIEPTTPIFDIVGKRKDTKSFVRFEVPVSEFTKIKKDALLQASLPGSSETISARVSRIAQSVNQNNQTVTIEGDFVGSLLLPLGTNVRVSGQGLSGASAVAIPSSAVLALQDGSMIVYKVLPNQTLKKVTIQVASQDSETTYIQGGITIDNTLVLHADDPQWSDGKSLEVNKETAIKTDHIEGDGHSH